MSKSYDRIAILDAGAQYGKVSICNVYVSRLEFSCSRPMMFKHINYYRNYELSAEFAKILIILLYCVIIIMKFLA